MKNPLLRRLRLLAFLLLALVCPACASHSQVSGDVSYSQVTFW